MTEGFERYPLLGAGDLDAEQPGWIIIGAFFITASALPLWQSLRESDNLGALVAGLFLGDLGLALIGVGLIRRARSPFRYLNAVVMTRAEQAPVDSWVHLAPTKPLPLPLTLSFCLGTLCAAGAAVFAGLQAFGAVPIANEQASDGGLFLGMIAMSVVAVVGGWLSWLLVGRRLRDGSFGRRPSGVALGERTVSVRVPGRDVEIPWTQIEAVVPRVLPGRRPMAMIELRLNRSGLVEDRVQMLSTTGWRVPLDALYSALRWYRAHPEARWELGRVEGQRRIEGWRAAALDRP